MTIARIEGAPAGPRWTARIAIFSLVLLATAVLMHRFLGMRTPVFLALVQLVLAGAVTSLVLGFFASIRIWRHGGQGAARILTGGIVALGLVAWPLAYAPKLRSLPKINDVTTSTSAPPAFTTLAAERQIGANSTDYPAAFAPLQRDAYPDLTTMVVNRSIEETYDVVVEAVRRQKLKIVREQPPTEENSRTGTLEAVDRTLIIGFYDDVAMRVSGGDTQATIDIRSASRYGRHDFGRNAERVRAIMREIVARLEATVSGSNGAERKSPRREEPASERRGSDRRKAPPRR